MQRKLKRIVLCCVLLCCAGHAGASFQEPDSVRTERDLVADPDAEEDLDTSYVEDDYTEQPVRRPVVYNRQTPTEARWLEATSDDAYTYRTKREYVARELPPPREDPSWLVALRVFLAFFLTTPGQVILWGLLALLVAYIVYRIIAGDGRLFSRRDVRPEPATAPAELSEDGLMELDWESRMRDALAGDDPRQAIRFGYLHVLQQLQARELIRFRPDKTNISYYRELGETHRPGFRNLTRVYEAAWYGGFLPDAGGLQSYIGNLGQFLQSIPKA